ncbi:MAG TPA: aliphatic sulfonates ABC transporter substrate-binding protein [Paenibacillaceae bacterium]|nr:aliphatic sulfonates ABC transporter substrate-binding protein [Paenibacillaceae bacterium]
MKLKKLWVTLLMITVLIGLIGCGAKGSKDTIGNETASTFKVHIAINGLNALLFFAKDKKWFEEEFKKIGAEVVWSEFPSGPPLLESLSAGRVDLSLLGDGPAISSVSNGLPVTLISQLSDGLKGSNILVVQGSSKAQKLADLKGKKIALAKGTTMHVFFIKAIQKEGLKESDFRIIQLQSEEAVAAFQSGAVDAWVGGDPYTSLLEKNHGARVLASGKSLNIKAPAFTIARTDFLKEHPEAVEVYLKVYQKAIDYQKNHFDEVATFVANLKKADKSVIELVIRNSEPLNIPISKEVLAIHQKSADILLNTGFIKKKIDVTKNVDNTFIEKLKK